MRASQTDSAADIHGTHVRIDCLVRSTVRFGVRDRGNYWTNGSSTTLASERNLACMEVLSTLKLLSPVSEFWGSLCYALVSILNNRARQSGHWATKYVGRAPKEVRIVQIPPARP